MKERKRGPFMKHRVYARCTFHKLFYKLNKSHSAHYWLRYWLASNYRPSNNVAARSCVRAVVVQYCCHRNHWDISVISV